MRVYLRRVEVECRAEPLLLCNLERKEVGGVVATGLDVTGATRRRAIVVEADRRMDPLHASLAKVVTHWRDGDHEVELRARLQAEDLSRVGRTGWAVRLGGQEP